MKLFYSLLFFLYSFSVFSQNTEFIILDRDSKKPLDGVQFYNNGVYISKTNTKGLVSLTTKGYNEILLVKEDYYDTIVKASNLTETIYLKKINALQLNEVIVTQLNYSDVLDTINKNTKNFKLFLTPNQSHYYNLFTKGKDTLTYLNKRILSVKGKGSFVDNIKGIVSNFTINDKNVPVYFIKNKELVFNFNYNHPQPPYNSMELQIVSQQKDKFEYTISKDDEHILITFTPKTKNKDYPYEGYIIVDIDSYGLLEFKATTVLKEKTNRRNLSYDNEVISYEVISEHSFIKYQKNDEGKYDLILYSFDSELKALNGDFKGQTFINKCRKEPTLTFELENGLPINLSTYKLRE